MKHWLVNIGIVGLILCFVIVGVLIFKEEQEITNDIKFVEALRDEVVVDIEEDENIDTTSASETNEVGSRSISSGSYLDRYINFDNLYSKSSDVFGWVYVPNTNIDYYVMKAPKGDTYKYLWTNIYNKKNSWGSIFTTYIGEDTATITLYGHRMRNKGLAFSNLRAFKTRSYGERRQKAYLYLPNKSQQYRLWAAVSSNQSDKIYEQPYVVGSEYYGDLIEDINGRKLYGIGDVPTKEDRLLILSTCNGRRSGSSERFYLVYVLEQEKQI